MPYTYILDGSTTAGKAAPADILSFIPGAGNIVKVVGIKIGSQGANALGPVTFAFGSLDSGVTGSTLTPIPHDQNALAAASFNATLTAKGTVTSNGGTLTRVTQWSFQQVSFVDLWFPDTPIILPPSASTIWAIRKTIGADTNVWSLELRVQEG